LALACDKNGHGPLGIIYQAPESDDEAAFLSGAAYVYRRAGSEWILEAILKSSSSLAEDIFGINVSTDGETVVVGAPGVQSLTGAAFVFEKVEGLWSETAKLTASNAGSQDRFGWAVGVSASRVVVGAFHEDSSQTTVTNGSASASDNNSSNAGAVYVYHRDDGLWTQEAYLKPSKLQAGLGMGKTLAICGDSIVASSGGDNSAQNYITHGETSPNDTDLPDAGAVYVFKR